MQLGLILFQDHEADRIAVLEHLDEAEHLRIEIARPRDVLDRKHRGNPSKTNSTSRHFLRRHPLPAPAVNPSPPSRLGEQADSTNKSGPPSHYGKGLGVRFPAITCDAPISIEPPAARPVEQSSALRATLLFSLGAGVTPAARRAGDYSSS